MSESASPRLPAGAATVEGVPVLLEPGLSIVPVVAVTAAESIYGAADAVMNPVPDAGVVLLPAALLILTASGTRRVNGPSCRAPSAPTAPENPADALSDVDRRRIVEIVFGQPAAEGKEYDIGASKAQLDERGNVASSEPIGKFRIGGGNGRYLPSA